MAGTYLGKYDTTAGSNTATASNSVSVAEGMLPSNINNALRDIMADVRQWYNTAEWIEYGDGAGTYTPAYASSTSFTISGANVTSAYHVGRRVKVVASTPGTIYGSITATAFSTNTTVTVAWDSGSLSNESITSVHIGAISASNTSLPETTAITGDYTLDVSGDIILDADGDNVTLKAAGTTALDFVLNGTTSATLDAPGDIHLDADGGDIKFYDDGTQFGEITNSSTDLVVKSTTSNKDVIIKGNDGGSAISALTLDMSEAGAASFNGDVTVGAKLKMSDVTSGKVLIADGTSYEEVALSGDASVNSSGVVAIGSGVVVNADVSSSAAIAFSKMADLTASRALVSDGSGDVSVSAVTSTEIGYLDGVASNVQTQIDNIVAGTVSTVNDGDFRIRDNGDSSKQIAFEASGISTSTTRTFTLPDENGTILTNVVNDTTPQLGGDLDTNSNNIKIDDAHFIADDDGNEQIIFQKTGSAVNELEVTNAATGDPPIIGASGETNVGLHIKPKGSGETIIGSGGAAATLTTSGAHDLVLDTNAGTNSGSITITDASNGAITLTPNGTGVVNVQGSMNSTLSSTGKAMVLGF